ncbi:MAG: hypothetical protein WC712_07420 [Candidatus Brocadiia bacterium]
MTSAQRPGTIPIVVGVTGHRHIRPEDVPGLEAAVRAVLVETQGKYPDTPILLLSSLAEGADRIAARVALDLGADLGVPLPMSAAEYEKDFSTPQSVEEFRFLLAKAAFSRVIDSSAMPGGSEDRNNRYKAAGIFIVEHCRFLIALWDGADKEVPGGTSQIVRIALRGLAAGEKPKSRALVQSDIRIVRHIVTPSKSNPSPKGTPCSSRLLIPANLSPIAQEKALSNLDRFNRDVCASRVATGPSQPEEFCDPKACPAEVAAYSVRYFAADAMAGSIRKRLTQFEAGVFFLAFFSVVCIELAHFPEVLELGLVGYLLFLAAATATYIVAERECLKNRHQDYRALAEGARVQLHWHFAGIEDCVCSHYLHKQRGELDWIHAALDAMHLMLPQRTASQHENDDIKALSNCRSRWVTPQKDYFSRKSAVETALSSKAKRFGMAALFVAVAIALFTLLSGYHSHWYLYLIMVISGAAGLLGAFKMYRAYGDLARRYSQMAAVFRGADGHLGELIKAGDIEGARSLVHELGRETLAENAEWLILNREHHLEIPHAG